MSEALDHGLNSVAKSRVMKQLGNVSGLVLVELITTYTLHPRAMGATEITSF